MANSPIDQARWFVALLPPLDLQNRVTAIKEDLWQRFQSKAALKSPPHITLQPPFLWPVESLAALNQSLAAFALEQAPIPIQLAGYSAFPPRVIYIDVQPEPSLFACQAALQTEFEATFGLTQANAQHHSFTPHMTVGFRDLKPAAFHRAWAEFKNRPFAASFVAQTLTLLRHDGQRWRVAADFPFGA
ncbi:MAG: 2'-5' RNA ligase family protein [Leptolyngbyaceae cyanobacterium SM2_5_2]|nr:2'-5' RNA ligase family protein [Leptolyngbyaceae cyanobacterium SM2_5_2]